MGGSCALTTLLVLTVIAVTRGQTQYFDILQGLQQLFRPYQGNETINLFNGATRAPHKQTNRQESKKKIVENRHQNEERRTRNLLPIYQYDNVFATTEKPSQKTTKQTTETNSVNRVKRTTTTEASYFNYNGNRGTTQNVFSNNFNVARPVTENVFEDVNHRETVAVNNHPMPTNLISNGASLDNTNNFGAFNGTSDTASVTFSDQPDQETVVLIGPDEDDMTELQKKRYVEKAEKMCDYYKSFTIKKVVAFPLIPSPEPEEIKASDCAPINLPLVIGGSVASIREFPHMALVGWIELIDASYNWICGGSLISDRYVLTAAQCTYIRHIRDKISGPPQIVQLGSSYLNDRGALVVNISAVIRHPKYKAPLVYHDIALIKMVSKVKFSEVIRPACLGVPPPAGRSVIATGWGKSESKGHHHVQLRSVSLSVWDMQECKDIWGTFRRLPNGVTPDSHMCAGDKEGLGHDTCQGDAGGPTQIQDGCLWRVVAVTSSGRSCGNPDTPGLYAVIPHAFIAAQVFEDNS